MTNEEKKVQKAVKELEKLLADALLKPGTNAKVEVVLWEHAYGGVRISEISVTDDNGGWSYLRYDIVNGAGPGVSKLLLMCEEWLVLAAYGDDVNDLPDLTKQIRQWDKPPKTSDRPRCRVCKKARAVFLVKEGLKNKKVKWTAMCGECMDDAPSHKVLQLDDFS